MKLAADIPQLLNSSLQMSVMSLSQAIELLSAPEEIREEVTAKIEAGEDVTIQENKEAITQAKRERDNAQSELERLKREQEKAIEHGVKIELGKLETEMNQKRYQIEVNARELEELKKVRRELDVEVGALAVHKDAIKNIKIELASLTMQFSDAFDTGTIQNEVTGDWGAIYGALSG